MANQAWMLRIVHTYNFVNEILGVEWLDPWGYLEHMRYAGIFQGADVRSSLEVAQVEAVNYFIHF